MATQPAQNGSMERLSATVLVIGAGLAGLATAISIQQAGHQVTILERMPEIREIGAGIQVSPNATRLLRGWGVLEAIESHAFQPEKTFLRSYRGGPPLAAQRMNIPSEERNFAPYLLLHRADLHRVLCDRAENLGAKIVLNAVIENMDIDTGNPSVRLRDGRVFEADVMIGADGERSICRDKLLGREDLPRSTNNLVYRFTVPAEVVQRHKALVELVDPPNVNVWMGPGAHVVSYMVKKDGLLNVALMLPQEPQDKTEYGVQPVAIEELREVFKPWDVKFGALLDMAQQSAKWTLLHADGLEKWAHEKGRFALIGDSAHAMMPCLAQGASQCFEDAAVLGTLFGALQRPEQLDNILSLYERLRKPRAMEVRRRSRQAMGELSLPDGPEQEGRDNELSGSTPCEGFPVSLMDPSFQNWLWGYNATEEAKSVWKEDLREIMP